MTRDRSALARLAADPGLCGTCRHLQLVGSRTSVFARCALSDIDPRFPRYPPLPVLRCAGYGPLDEKQDARPGQPRENEADTGTGGEEEE